MLGDMVLLGDRKLAFVDIDFWSSNFFQLALVWEELGRLWKNQIKVMKTQHVLLQSRPFVPKLVGFEQGSFSYGSGLVL